MSPPWPTGLGGSQGGSVKYQLNTNNFSAPTVVRHTHTYTQKQEVSNMTHSSLPGSPESTRLELWVVGCTPRDVVLACHSLFLESLGYQGL